jgi:hypothetical protein
MCLAGTQGPARRAGPAVNLTRDQLDRIGRIGDQWSLLWDKRRRLWIAAENDEHGEQIEEADLDVLLDRLIDSPTPPTAWCGPRCGWSLPP